MAPVVQKAKQKNGRISSKLGDSDLPVLSRRTSLRKRTLKSENMRKLRSKQSGDTHLKPDEQTLNEPNEERVGEKPSNSYNKVEENFECGICYKHFQSIDLLSSHLHNHDMTNSFQCNVCDAFFPTSDSLCLHLEEHSDVVKPFKCGICSARFVENAFLLDHMCKSHKELPSLYKCRVCSLSFFEISKLIVHVGTKHSSNSKTFKCVLCSKYFTKGTELSLHVQEHTHDSSKLSKCAICFSKVPASIMNTHILIHEKEKSEGVLLTTRRHSSRKSKKAISTRKIVNEEKDMLLPIDNTSSNSKGKNANSCVKLNLDLMDAENEETISENEDVKIKRRRKEKRQGYSKPIITKNKPSPAIKDTKKLIATYMKVDSETGNEVYDCDVCGVRESDQDSFIQHRDDHFCDGKFCINCQHCSRVFGSFEDLDEHIGPDKCTGYKCNTCGKSFSLEPVLLTHQVREHSNLKKQDNVFTCATCEKIFKNKTAFIRHASSHSEDKCIQCKLCRHAFTTQETLLGHLRTSHSIIPLKRKQYKFNCDICGAYFMKAEALTKHQAAIHNIENNSVSVVKSDLNEENPKLPQTKKKFNNGLTVKRSGHWRNAEDDKKRRTCPICSRVFARFKDVRRHIGTHTKPFLCSHCGKSFPYGYSLDAHIKAYHSAESPHKCETCDRFFSCQRSLIVHRRIHTGEKPHQCHICNKRFRQAANLSMHIKLHSTDKPIKCELCDYRCSHQGYLKRHMSTHSSEKKHTCPICNKGFTEKPNLNHHLKRHSKVKNHVCAVCGHRFAERYYLNNHMRIHTKEKPYVCPVCNRAFTMRPNMVSHIKKTHPSYKYQPIRPTHKQVADFNKISVLDPPQGNSPVETSIAPTTVTAISNSYSSSYSNNDNNINNNNSIADVITSTVHRPLTTPSQIPPALPQQSIMQLLSDNPASTTGTDLLHHHVTNPATTVKLSSMPFTAPRDLLAHFPQRQQQPQQSQPIIQADETVPRDLNVMGPNILHEEAERQEHHYVNMTDRFVPPQFVDAQRIASMSQNFPGMPMANQDYMYTYPNMPQPDNFIPLPVQGFFSNHQNSNTHPEQKP